MLPEFEPEPELLPGAFAPELAGELAEPALAAGAPEAGADAGGFTTVVLEAAGGLTMVVLGPGAEAGGLLIVVLLAGGLITVCGAGLTIVVVLGVDELK